jgi:hypothetical protein
VDESVFSQLTPVLNQIDMTGAVLELFGQIAHLSPVYVRNELPKIIEFGMAALTPDSNLNNRAIAEAFGMIAQILPISFAEYIGGVATVLIGLMQLEYPE